jgi:HEPN domain-containing protein
MKPLTLEWTNKAEGDWISAQRELRARKSPNFDAACFHSQQSAEKYLKARMTEAGLAFGKTHNLIALLASVVAVEPGWINLHPQLTALDVYAVAYRYPGNSAGKGNAQAAVKNCGQVRREVRLALGLQP